MHVDERASVMPRFFSASMKRGSFIALSTTSPPNSLSSHIGCTPLRSVHDTSLLPVMSTVASKTAGPCETTTSRGAGHRLPGFHAQTDALSGALMTGA